MTAYQMTEGEKERFLSGDEGRGEIRGFAAKAYAGAESVQIIDSAGDLFDTVTGGEFVADESSEEPGFAVALSDDELEEKRTVDALRIADVERIENEIKPLVYQKLKDEARTEIRSEFRETVRKYATENVSLREERSRLVAGTSALQTKYNQLVGEYEALKATIPQ